MNKSYLMHNKLLPLLLVSLLLLLITSCAGAAAAPAEQPPLKVAWSPFPGWYPLAIALEQDLFTKHGVAVEPVFYEVSEWQMPDFEAGKLDGGFFALGEALILDSRSPDTMRLVLATDNSAGADVIVARPEVAGVADLRGKRLGASLTSFSELLVRTMLAQHGLSISDITLVNVSADKVPDSLSGVIQAGHTWEPFTSIATARGYHVIFSSAETPGLIPDVLIFRKPVVEQRPQEVRAFMAAWFEAVAYWQAHPAEGNEIIARALDLNPAEVSAEGVKLFGLEDNQRAFSRSSDPTSLYTGGQTNINFLISTGTLSNAPDLEQLLDASFLK